MEELPERARVQSVSHAQMLGGSKGHSMKAHDSHPTSMFAGIIARSLFHAYMVQPFQAFPSMLELPYALPCRVHFRLVVDSGKQASSHLTRVGF